MSIKLHESSINDPIRDFLRQFSGKTVSYFPNPGNGGDSLIALGTYHLFTDLNINIEVVSDSDDVTGRIVILGGGGNLVPYYGHMKTAVKNFAQKAKQIVLLPHTLRSAEQVLSLLDNRCHIFCRDIPSYQHVLDSSNLQNVYIAHDMAFNIDPDRILQDGAIAEIAKPSFAHRLDIRNISTEDYVGKGIVPLFRQDGEARGSKQKGLLDLSQVFAFGVHPEAAARSAWCFLEFVRRCDAIASDRLHIGIAGALLNRPTHIFDNSYGKNFSIYQHSLRKVRDNVSFYRLEGTVEPLDMVRYIDQERQRHSDPSIS